MKEPNTSGLVMTGEAVELAKQADAAIADAPIIKPEDEDYAVGEVSPEGEIKTVRIYGRDVPVGLLTENADPKCPTCWSTYKTPLQGSYVATRVGSRGQMVRQRQLCECCVRRYVKKYPKEERKQVGIKVTRVITGDDPWVLHAERLRKQLDKLGAEYAALDRTQGRPLVQVAREMKKVQHRYDRARERAGLA
jgi:hypothetical protein